MRARLASAAARPVAPAALATARPATVSTSMRARPAVDSAVARARPAEAMALPTAWLVTCNTVSTGCTRYRLSARSVRLAPACTARTMRDAASASVVTTRPSTRLTRSSAPWRLRAAKEAPLPSRSMAK
eukprot:scaffold4512_cov76-Phaeocystis_antarctica.AAC.3